MLMQKARWIIWNLPRRFLQAEMRGKRIIQPPAPHGKYRDQEKN